MDKRGFFMETYNRSRYFDAGIQDVFIQDNLSYSVKGTLRGLHYQNPHAQAKLIQVIKGVIFDVAVDIRAGSPTFGQWVSALLSDENKRQIYIPQGFAHGFCVLSESAFVLYTCSDYYAPDCEKGILWSDFNLNIDWPVTSPILSKKDKKYPCLCDVPVENLPLIGKASQ